MKNHLFSALIILSIISCEFKKTETVTTKTEFPDSVVVPETLETTDSNLETCYLSVVGKDSALISVNDNLGTITGKLQYKNFEKDSNFGEIIGSSNEDTLKVNYTFESEGKTSTREIWFLQKNGALLEGYGAYDASGQTYADTKKITFQGASFNAIDCDLWQKLSSQKKK